MEGHNINSLNDFAKEVHENAVKYGFWKPEPSFGEIVALCHSELSEALEEYRNGMPMAYALKEHPNGTRYIETDMDKWTPDDKPEGIAVEMADCLIRVLDWFGSHPELDPEAILTAKHRCNLSRPYRHGNRRL